MPDISAIPADGAPADDAADDVVAAQSSVTAEISVIIVNYGTAALTIEAVQSVLDHRHGGRAVDVHVVDNASPENSGPLLAEAHAARGWGERVVLYLEAENHGFGRGNNVALRALAARAVPPRLVMALNPDARLKTETIDALATFIEANPRIGLVGCGIDRPEGGAVPAVFRFPNIRGEFSGALGFGPVSRLFGRYLTAGPANPPTGPVEWVSGAAFMARLPALEEAGFFDPDYFLYFEESDLMARLTRLGWEIWHLSGVSIEHVAGAATGMQAGRHKSRAQPGYWYDSWRLYFVKNRGPWYARAAALARLSGWALNVPLQALRGRPPAGPRHFLRDFSRHVLGPLLRPGGGSDLSAPMPGAQAAPARRSGLLPPE